ncbi:MAG: hypothetical protein R2794_07395 [Chitinophagales bacterium]
MKIRNKLFTCILLTLPLLPSCGLFHGGNKCDCPHFGQAVPATPADLAAVAAPLG